MSHTNIVLASALCALVACQGPEGSKGEDGLDGEDGAPGQDGGPGADGADGQDGATGPEGEPGEVDPALGTWDKVLVGIGGEAALAGLAGFTIEAAGDRYMGYEGYAPFEGPAGVSTFDTVVSDDRGSEGVRYDWSRSITAFGGVPLAYSEIVTGDVGVVDGVDSVFGTSTGDMPSSRWAAVVKQHRLLNPHLILLDVLADPSIATESGSALFAGVMHEVLTIEDDVAPIELYVDPGTGHIGRLVTLENHHLLRDVPLEAQYWGWQSYGAGPLFPSDVAVLLDGEPLHVERRADVTLGAPAAGTFDLPTGSAPVHDAALADFGERSHNFHGQFASLALPFDLLQTFVSAVELAPGVFWVGGGSHNSMAIEQDGGVVIVEAPLYPERSEALLDWAATQFPTKPVSHVVASHHHMDHAGGLRAFVARGIPVVTSAHSETFLREVFRAPSTVVPDALSASPATAVILTVPDNGSLTLDDPTNPVVAWHIPTGHAVDVLVVEAADHVFNSDLWNPGYGGSAVFPPTASELLDFVDTRIGGTPTQVGGHATFGPYEELAAYVDAL
jgi:glyoxylase-like metal-dependent hydrolase (beta-lactamase superfamily II)